MTPIIFLPKKEFVTGAIHWTHISLSILASCKYCHCNSIIVLNCSANKSCLSGPGGKIKLFAAPILISSRFVFARSSLCFASAVMCVAWKNNKLETRIQWKRIRANAGEVGNPVISSRSAYLNNNRKANSPGYRSNPKQPTREIRKRWHGAYVIRFSSFATVLDK